MPEGALGKKRPIPSILMGLEVGRTPPYPSITYFLLSCYSRLPLGLKNFSTFSTPQLREGYLILMNSLRFLVSSIWNLGPSLGIRYWKIYRATLSDPSLLVRWERRCRWESAQVESTDPVASKFLEEWADHLSKYQSERLDIAQSRQS
jgi:hypothetical protein